MEEQKHSAVETDEIMESNSEEEAVETLEQKLVKRRREQRLETALFFILGLLIGFTLKTEAIKRFTMGFDDYLLRNGKQEYDIAKIKGKLIEEAQLKQQQQEALKEEDSTSAEEDPAADGQQSGTANPIK